MPSADALALTGDQQLNRWNIGAPVGTSVVVTFSFPTQAPAYDTTARPGFAAYTPQQQEWARQALATWGAVAGIAFVEVPEISRRADPLFALRHDRERQFCRPASQWLRVFSVLQFFNPQRRPNLQPVLQQSRRRYLHLREYLCRQQRGCDGTPAQGIDSAQFELALRAQVKKIADQGVRDSELRRVKTQYVASQVYKRDSIMGQAMEFASLEIVGFSHRDADRILEKIRSVTAAEVQAVASKYFGDDALTVVNLLPQPLSAKPRSPANPNLRHSR